MVRFKITPDTLYVWDTTETEYSLTAVLMSDGVFFGGCEPETDGRLIETLKNVLAGKSIVPFLERVVEMGPDSVSVCLLDAAKKNKF